eukprot:3653525-Lingulodinium_polyedra.AAC.1
MGSGMPTTPLSVQTEGRSVWGPQSTGRPWPQQCCLGVVLGRKAPGQHSGGGSVGLVPRTGPMPTGTPASASFPTLACSWGSTGAWMIARSSPARRLSPWQPSQTRGGACSSQCEGDSRGCCQQC